jgi:hypothetical protein
MDLTTFNNIYGPMVVISTICFIFSNVSTIEEGFFTPLGKIITKSFFCGLVWPLTIPLVIWNLSRGKTSPLMDGKI